MPLPRTTRSPLWQIAGLIGWLVLVYAAAGAGAFASAQAGAFYRQLQRPAWAPPGWLFGPVWSALYTLMAVAVWLVWRQRGLGGARVAIALFLIQLIANALWTWLFFAWRQGALASIEIVMLWLLIAATMAAFWPINRVAALLLAPYLAWVTFATALSFAIWRANPGLLS